MERYSYVFHNGYYDRTDTRTVDVMQVFERLRGRQKRKYDTAKRVGNRVELRKIVTLCPYCGKEFRYRDTKLGSDEHGIWFREAYRESLNVTDEELWMAFNPQTSLFPQETELAFSFSYDTKSRRTCRHCGRESEEATGTFRAEILRCRQKIRICCEVHDLKNVLNYPGMNLKNNRLTFPLTESVTFDLRRGKAYLELRDGDNGLIAVRDITDCGTGWHGRATYRLLDNYPVIRRKFRFLYRKITGYDLPIPSPSPEQYIRMCRFIGYERDFYYAIPYRIGCGDLEPAFETMAKKLHLAENVPNLVQASSLPKGKAIRKRIFRQPEYLFYLRELETIQNELRDSNYLQTFLEDDFSFEFLAKMHMYPIVDLFFHDYAETVGRAGLARRILYDEKLIEQAKQYGTLHPAIRKMERRKWKDKSEQPQEEIPFTYPVHIGSVPDCEVDGYSFRWLRSREEYSMAAKEMDNCLATWQGRIYPVLVMRRIGSAEILAAIALEEKTTGTEVAQAFTSKNRIIYDNPELTAVYKKWMELHELNDAEFRSIFVDMDNDGFGDHWL